MNTGISERAGVCEDILSKKRRVWMSASGSGSSLLDIIPLNWREKRKALAPSCLDDDDSGEFNTWLGKTPALIQYLKIYLGFRSGVRQSVGLKPFVGMFSMRYFHLTQDLKVPYDAKLASVVLLTIMRL